MRLAESSSATASQTRIRYALLRPEIRIIDALWQIHADTLSFDKLVDFFVSRFKKNPAIT
jgi:hypothetical protein